MDLKVIGRHALFFDDDQMATFVNSSDALVVWNSIPIDRYDVRHLLTTPPPSRRSFRRHGSSSPPIPDSSIQSDLDHQRFMDLPTQQEPDLHLDDPLKVEDNYHKVGFSYTGPVQDTGTGFRPPFPLPPALLGHTPGSEKTHQIIARTALFVQRQGVQSEFVLRMKQGDNPKFGFLAPGNHLHPYFRYLVDNRGVLDTISVETSRADAGDGSALSLLGSVYGSVEDDNRDPSTSAEDRDRTELELERMGREGRSDPFDVNGLSHFTASKTDMVADPPVGRPSADKSMIERAKKHSRFLPPSNQEEEKSRLLGLRNPKGEDGTGRPSKKKTPFPKRGGVGDDHLHQNEFKMVIAKSKNPSTPPRPEFGVSVDATAAAAILQAATRGIGNPTLSISLSGTWIDPTASIRSDNEPPPRPNPDRLTKEQKLKSERLKKAKLFLLGVNSAGPPPSGSTPDRAGRARSPSVSGSSDGGGGSVVRSRRKYSPEAKGGRHHGDVGGKSRRYSKRRNSREGKRGRGEWLDGRKRKKRVRGEELEEGEIGF